MKNDKKKIWLIAGVIVLAAVIALLLAMCGRGGDPGENGESSEPAQLSETSEASEATTEPTEETTEPTEEPTEETEATEPEGNSHPGGTSGPGLDTGRDDEEEDSTEPTEEELVVSDPGAVDNPYVEAVSEYPASFDSVVLPASGTVYYEVYGVNGGVLTIEDADAYVILGGVTYKADENGIVSVELNAEGKFVSLQLGRNGAAPLELCFNGPVGSLTNPMILEGLEQIQVSLEENDEDGFYYQWTCDADCAVTLAAESEDLDIIVQIGDHVISLSENGVTDPETGVRTLEFEADAGDEVLIQVIGVQNENGIYPAVETVVSGQVEKFVGTEEEPIVRTLEELPASVTTEVIPEGRSLWYEVYGVGGATLTIRNADAVVTYSGAEYTADENGVVTVELGVTVDGRPACFQVRSGEGTSTQFEMEFYVPEGSYSNPTQLVLGANTAELAENSLDGWWFTWTAEADGELTIWVDTELAGNGWAYSVTNVTADAAGETHLSSEDPQVTSETIQVAAGDVILVNVNTYDPDSWDRPAGSVTVHAEFTAADAEGEDTEDPAEPDEEPGVTDDTESGKETDTSEDTDLGESTDPSEGEEPEDGTAGAGGETTPEEPGQESAEEGTEESDEETDAEEPAASEETAGETAAEPYVVWLKPDEAWLSEEARFAVYLWNDTEQVWIDLELDEETGLYSVELPEGYTNLQFCRMDPAVSENGWDSCLDKSDELTLDLTVADRVYLLETKEWKTLAALITEE